MEPNKKNLFLVDKSLSINFDVVDFSGGSKPFFQYAVGDGKRVSIGENHLNFPTIPNGTFKIKIRAFFSKLVWWSLICSILTIQNLQSF